MTDQPQQRRQHNRVKVECPVTFFTRSGEVAAKGKSVNLSNGGILVSIPVEEAGKIRGTVNLTFSVPRSTENTYMLEDFACQADILRRQALVGENSTGVAVAFTRPLNLDLEV